MVVIVVRMFGANLQDELLLRQVILIGGVGGKASVNKLRRGFFDLGRKFDFIYLTSDGFRDYRAHYKYGYVRETAN